MRPIRSLPRLLPLLAALLACGEDDPAPRPPAPAGGTEAAVPAPKPWFVDEAVERGVTLLNQTGTTVGKELIMEAVGPGAAVFDANGDGLMDIYIPNGNRLIGPFRTEFYLGDDRPRNALYIQRPGGTFVDEANARGVDDDAWGFGACAADLDDDGDQDLIVANLGPNRLYVNDGKGFFRDAAPAAGIAGPDERGAWDWSTGIAVADYDRDGRLDIYIANYADLFKWMRESSDVRRRPDGSVEKANTCRWQRLEVYCGPKGLPGQQDYLYRGLGGRDGEIRFADVTKSSGVARPDGPAPQGPLYGFQPLFTDLNNDGWPDIYVANDSVPSTFFENRGDGTFRECAHEYGIAVGDGGDHMAGMGAESMDVNGDGWLDIHKTNFALQTNNLYIAEPVRGGDGKWVVTYRDHSSWTSIQEVVFNDLGWSVLVFDYDHDGDRDIFYANGHVYPEVDAKEAQGLNTSFRQYNRMLQNVSDGQRVRFRDVGADLGPGFRVRKGSRGASLLDLDEDGDLDILVVNLNDTPELLVNRRGSESGHWLMLELRGNPAKKVPLDAIGCRLHLKAGERGVHYETKRGQGFLGCNDPRVHFGLGAHAGPVELEIWWPNGETTAHRIEAVDRVVEIALE